MQRTAVPTKLLPKSAAITGKPKYPTFDSPVINAYIFLDTASFQTKREIKRKVRHIREHKQKNNTGSDKVAKLSLVVYTPLKKITGAIMYNNNEEIVSFLTLKNFPPIKPRRISI